MTLLKIVRIDGRSAIYLRICSMTDQNREIEFMLLIQHIWNKALMMMMAATHICKRKFGWSRLFDGCDCKLA